MFDVGLGSFGGLREQRLTGSTNHETGPPESRHSPPAPHAALPPAVWSTLNHSFRLTAVGRDATDHTC
jgi:hypothetical protein